MRRFDDTTVAIALCKKGHEAFVDGLREKYKASALLGQFNKVEKDDHIIYHAKSVRWDPNSVDAKDIVTLLFELFKDRKFRIEYTRMGADGVFDMEFRHDYQNGEPWLRYSRPEILY